MGDWTNGAIAAAAAIVSSGLTGALTLKATGRQADERRIAELGNALQAFGYAVDNLGIEVGQLPPQGGRAASVTQAATSQLPTFEWAVGQLSRQTVGRPAMRALDTYSAAFNRLILIAPADVLEAMETINALLGRLEQRDDSWKRSWTDARARLVEVSRGAVSRIGAA